MGNDDIFKSNGTCYSSRGKEADGDYHFLPCGNAGLLNTDFACCSRGDKCLSSNACYHSKSGITYVAGCTDEEYTHPACPQKSTFDDQEWVGLVWCKSSDDDADNDGDKVAWVGCKESAGKPLDDKPSKCTCDDDDNKEPLFHDSTVLANVAVLPMDPKTDTIYFYPGYVPSMPTAAPSSSTTGSPTTPTSSVETSATALPPPAADAEPRKPFSASETVGLGVGAGAGGLLAVYLAYLGTQYWRRRKRRQEREERRRLRQEAETTNKPEPPASGGATEPYFFKSELPADEPKSLSPFPTANSPDSSSVSASHSISCPYSTPQHEYQAYDPRRHSGYAHSRDHSNDTHRLSTVSDMSIAVGGSTPPIPISPDEQQGPHGRPGLAPICELQG